MNILSKIKNDPVSRLVVYTMLSALTCVLLCFTAVASILLGRFIVAASSLVLIGVVSVVGEHYRRKANLGFKAEGNDKHHIPPMLFMKWFVKER